MGRRSVDGVLIVVASMLAGACGAAIDPGPVPGRDAGARDTAGSDAGDPVCPAPLALPPCGDPACGADDICYSDVAGPPPGVPEPYMPNGDGLCHPSCEPPLTCPPRQSCRTAFFFNYADAGMPRPLCYPGSSEQPCGPEAAGAGCPDGELCYLPAQTACTGGTRSCQRRCARDCDCDGGEVCQDVRLHDQDSGQDRADRLCVPGQPPPAVAGTPIATCEPELLATLEGSAGDGTPAMAVDARYVYFWDGDRVARTARVNDGGGDPAAAETVHRAAGHTALALDGNWLYRSYCGDTGGGLVRIDVTTLAVEELVSDGCPYALAPSGSVLYFANNGLPGDTSLAGLWRLELGTGAVLQRVSDLGNGVMSRDQSGAYGFDGSGNLLRLPWDGGPPESLQRGLVDVVAMVASGDDLHLIHTDDTGYHVVRVPLDGPGTSHSPPVTLGEAPNTNALAVDTTHVYWLVDVGDERSALVRVPRAGGALEVVRNDLQFGFSLTQDDEAIYWLSQGVYTACGLVAGGVYRLPRRCIP
jgi:hypothetical protein